MRVLHVISCFYPATYWGGPVFSTKAICDGVGARPDHALRVLTTDTAGPNLGERVQPTKMSYPVTYCRRVAGHAVAPGMIARLPAAISWADVVHLTGVYNAPTLPAMALARALGKPLVWSPRGALQATEGWADVPRLRAKRLFHRAVATVLPTDAIIHATSQAEADSAARLFPNHICRIIPNAVEVPAVLPKGSARHGLRLMYLGRLHPKKGIDLLLDAMRGLPDVTTLDIYGDGPTDYVFALKRKAQGVRRQIRFHGHIDGVAKTDAFTQADLFVLPSYSENFGIAVAEALAHGVPVLTTDATPWQDIVRHGCGGVISLDRDDLSDAIARLAQQDLAEMGVRGRDWMRRDFGVPTMIDRFVALYHDASGQSIEAVTA